MNPTFKEIWSNNALRCCEYHPQTQYKRTRGYYRVRSVVRIAFWMPLAVWGYTMILGLI